jgi:hypothetical protein
MMNDHTAKRPSRREILRSTLRYLGLGGICLGSAGLIARGAASPDQGGCRWSPSCGDCAALADCTLPRALAAKGHSER